MSRKLFVFRFAVPLIAVCCIPACSDQAARDESATPPAGQASDPVDSQPSGRAFRYTSLDGCRLLRSSPEEAGFYEHECPGEGGYTLKLVEADLRQNLILIAPGGAAHSLGLPALAQGAFSELGKTVEWRGVMEDGSFRPDALILRQQAVEDPEGQKEVSYLVAVRLAGSPCAIARIAPGAGQNEKARVAADRGSDCLIRPG